MPKSLFGRMILILVGGLLAGQMLSAAIQLVEREKSLSLIIWTQAAQGIAAYIRLLDATPPDQRERAASLLTGAPLQVAMGRKFSGPPIEGSDAADIETLIHGQVGEKRMVKLFSTGEIVPYYWPRNASFAVQTRLQDGEWVSFHYRRKISHIFPNRMLINLVTLLVVLMILSLVAVHWVTRPLNLLARAADELGKNINRPPLPEQGSTEMKRAARAFNTMQTRLLEYLQSRARIHAAMSHDLKTPITRLTLRAELLEDADLKAKFVKDLEEMDNMVTTSLNLMRGIGNGETPRPVDINALLGSIQDDQMEMGGDVAIQGEAKTTFLCKPQALKRALVNLVENAIKYGNKAVISVEEDAEFLRIRVRDNGPGIPEDKLDLVTEPFYRLETSRCRDTGGTGLGLAISKAIAELHGGGLSLVNHPAGGLVTTLTLPRT
ncbi:MAG: HAMP domain-containing protein [Burkholderiales bacterium]|nr:HAMP domain-containing protein [Burkholderiales bacterium]